MTQKDKCSSREEAQGKKNFFLKTSFMFIQKQATKVYSPLHTQSQKTHKMLVAGHHVSQASLQDTVFCRV